MSSTNEARTWSDEEASKYCSTILGKPVKAFFKKDDGSGFLARAEHGDTIIFYRRELPRWVLWHEVGHLAEAPGGIYDIVAPRVNKICFDIAKLPEFDMSAEEMASAGEEALSEVKAHLWAISKAISSGESDVACELVEAVDFLPESKPSYAQAAAILRRVLDDVL